MSSLIQNIIILGGIVVILGLGFYLYTQKSSEAVEGGVSVQIELENEEFLRRLKELQSIELNGEIFSDARFLSLKNFSAPVISEPVGRLNPFEVTD